VKSEKEFQNFDTTLNHSMIIQHNINSIQSFVLQWCASLVPPYSVEFLLRVMLETSQQTCSMQTRSKT